MFFETQAELFLSRLTSPGSRGYHGGQRGVRGHPSAGLDQAAESPTGRFTGAWSLFHPPPLRCYSSFYDPALLHSLLLLRETKIPGFQSSAPGVRLTEGKKAGYGFRIQALPPKLSACCTTTTMMKGGSIFQCHWFVSSDEVSVKRDKAEE